MESWRLTYFGSSENSGIAANDFDVDSDGIANLVEYATGTDPTTPNGSPLTIGSNPDGPGMALIFARIADPSIHYEIEGSSLLSADDWEMFWSDTGSSAETIVIPDTLWPADQPRYFFRLGVRD